MKLTSSLTRDFAINLFKERLLDFLAENRVVIYCNEKIDKPIVLIIDANKNEKRLSIVDFISLVVSGEPINKNLIGRIKGFQQAIQELDQNIYKYLEQEKEDEKIGFVAIKMLSFDEDIFVTGFENTKTKEEFVKISDFF